MISSTYKAPNQQHHHQSNKMCRNSILRRPYYILVLILLLITYYTLFTGPPPSNDFRILKKYPVITISSSSSSTTEDLTQQQPIDEEEHQHCQFPKLDLNDPEILSLMEKEILEPLDCTKKYPLLFNSSVEPYSRLRPAGLHNNLPVKSCCYRQINFPEKEHGDIDKLDLKTVFSEKCFPVELLEETRIPEEREFISVECVFKENSGNDSKAKIVDMHAFVPFKKKMYSRKGRGRGADKLNVVILGMDSVSRLSMMRNMPETLDYLRNTMKAVDMEGFNKIGDNTYPNIGPLLTNHYVSDNYMESCIVNNSADKCNFIWKKYEQHGYHTLYAEDELDAALVHHLKIGFEEKNKHSAKYHFIPFLNIMNKYLGHEKRITSNMCIGPRTAPFQILDYMKKVAHVMSREQENFFQFGWSSSFTHDFIKGPNLLDKEMKETLQWYYEGGYLENTVLFVLSDHGARIGDIRRVNQGELEDKLPFMFVVVPEGFRSKNAYSYQNLVNNRKRLITTWDLHRTLVHIVEQDNFSGEMLSALDIKSELEGPSFKGDGGISLFLPVSKDRTCKLARVPLTYCACNRHMESIPVDHPSVFGATTCVLHDMNTELYSHPLCCQLTLGKVLQATKITFHNVPQSKWTGYRVVFTTNPEFTTYDALVEHEVIAGDGDQGVGKWKLGNVGRSTWYWMTNDTNCLGEYTDEKMMAMFYCYCKNNLKE